MNTATKVIGGAAIIGLIALGMRKKKTTTTTTAAATSTIKVNPYEGKTVQNTGARNWWVVINGKRYGYVSGAAFSAYYANNIASGEQIQLSDEELATMPEAGFIDESGKVVMTAKLGNPFPSTFIGV